MKAVFWLPISHGVQVIQDNESQHGRHETGRPVKAGRFLSCSEKTAFHSSSNSMPGHLLCHQIEDSTGNLKFFRVV